MRENAEMTHLPVVNVIIVYVVDIMLEIVQKKEEDLILEEDIIVEEDIEVDQEVIIIEEDIQDQEVQDQEVIEEEAIEDIEYIEVKAEVEAEEVVVFLEEAEKVKNQIEVIPLIKVIL